MLATLDALMLYIESLNGIYKYKTQSTQSVALFEAHLSSFLELKSRIKNLLSFKTCLTASWVTAKHLQVLNEKSSQNKTDEIIEDLKIVFSGWAINFVY